MSAAPRPVSGTAAGVPFLALPPPGRARPGAPVVVAWHLMDPPRTEAAFAAALPMAGLDAWRIYLGLPMCGARLPAGGQDELMRRGYADAVLNLQGPIAAQGAEEFPAALAELRTALDLGDGPLALLGGSMGSAVALLVLTETAPVAEIPVRAAVLVSPMVQLRPAVDATGRRFGVSYPWGATSLAVPTGWTSSPVPTSCWRPSRPSSSSSEPTTTGTASSNRHSGCRPRSPTATTTPLASTWSSSPRWCTRSPTSRASTRPRRPPMPPPSTGTPSTGCAGT